MPDQRLFPDDKPVKRIRRPRAVDEVWETLAALFFPSGVAFTDRPRLGKWADTFRQKGATQRELILRRNRYKAEWPERACTIEALAKHWDQFKDPSAAELKQAAKLKRQRKQQAEFLVYRREAEAECKQRGCVFKEHPRKDEEDICQRCGAKR